MYKSGVCMYLIKSGVLFYYFFGGSVVFIGEVELFVWLEKNVRLCIT